MAHTVTHAAYHRLTDRLNRFPQGAPPSELLTKILMVLFDRREAELVSLLPIRPFTVARAADVWHMPHRDLTIDKFQPPLEYMLEAFKYGAPPHGGIALGFDRLVSTLANRPYIRDVIAFPKTQKGQDLMNDAPSSATPQQLRALHIEVVDQDD